jgi:hypothetical protein
VSGADGRGRRACSSPYRLYVERRFADDPHLDASVLLRELCALGFDRSFQTLTLELRRLALRPECPVCKRGGHRLTIELAGRIRAVLSDGMDFAHLVAALDGVLRRLGGTARSWRTDRMATLVEPGSDRLRSEAAELARHYGVTIAVCPPRGRSARGGRGGDPLRRALLVAHRAGR